MISLLVICLLAAGPTNTGDLFKQEAAFLNGQKQELEIIHVQESDEHKKELARKQQELGKLQEKLTILKQKNNQLENEIKKLQEQHLHLDSQTEKGSTTSDLAAKWAKLGTSSRLQKQQASYFGSNGEPISGEIYTIGEISAIALSPKSAPLVKQGEKWQVAAVTTGTEPPLYPVFFKDNQNRHTLTFLEYMQSGGPLTWPLLALGILVLILGFDWRQKRRKNHLKALTLIATAAPLLGLLGTVMGIMEAFNVLSQGQESADPLALSGGISEALITTEMGLIVAVTALFFHHLRNRERAGNDHPDT